MTAYVPPDTPGDAFLEHERTTEPLLLIGVGLLFVVATAYSALGE